MEDGLKFEERKDGLKIFSKDSLDSFFDSLQKEFEEEQKKQKEKRIDEDD